MNWHDAGDHWQLVSTDDPGLPFAGITIGQARVVNDALWNLRVLVCSMQKYTPKSVTFTPGGRPTAFEESQLQRFAFRGIKLPGDSHGDYLQEVGDMRLIPLDDEGYPKGGISRIISINIVQHFIVTDRIIGWNFCHACDRYMPLTEKIYDVTAREGDSGTWWNCRSCFGPPYW